MRDDVFGDSDTVETERRIGMAVPARSLNSIEQALLAQFVQVTDGVVPPPPFIDGDTGEIDDGEYAGLPPRIALDLRNMLLLDAESVLRKQLIIARELGPTRPDGGPWSHEYEIACQAEGIVPWPLGDALVHER